TGSVTLPEAVRFGNYLLKEIQAPEGYVLDDKFIPITINGDEVTVTTEVTDNAQKGLLILNKKAKLLTQWTEGSDKVMTPVFEEKYLAGTTWELRAKEDIVSGDKVTVLYHKGDVIQTLTTTENGRDKFNRVPLGKYELEEVATLPQYVKDNNIYDITFTPQEQTVEVDSQIKNAYNKRKTINFTFNKYFEESALFTNTKEATFGLFNAESYTENGVTLPADSMIGKVTITQKHKEPEQPIEVEKATIETPETKELEPTEADITTEKGDEEFTEETTQPKVAVEDEVNKEQQVATNDKENEQVMVQGTFNDIFVDGTLYIRELTTSEKYVLDETNHDITIDFNNITEEVTTETVVTPIENELKRGGIELVKIEMGSETENRLDGAEYKLVAVDDIKGETEVGRFTTVNGMIHIEDLEYGHYYLEETKAPEGFILDATRIVVELFGNQNHIVKQIFAENEKIPEVKTTLMEQGTNNKEIHAEKVTLVDTVAYKDLIVGQE
ncbi:Cna protein B-type domain-containing protein, partial [Granulicatella balaenopterae]